MLLTISLQWVNKLMNHLASSGGDCGIKFFLLSMQQFSHSRQEITLRWEQHLVNLSQFPAWQKAQVAAGAMRL